MGTNIVSKELSRVYTHITRAKDYAETYADKMRSKGYIVDVRCSEHVYPPIYRVDVLRKK